MRATTKTALASKAASTKAPAPNGATQEKTNGAVKGAAPRKTAPAKGAVAVAAPPPWKLPTVPNGFKAPGVDIVRRRSKPTEQMRAEGQDFAAELRSGTTYADDFGKRAPDPAALADLVEIATQWDRLYDAAAPVAEYALAMRGAAWDAALKPANKLQVAYGNAVADEPSLATTWRKTAAFFGAREEPAQRAAETRAKAKKEAKKQAKAGTGAAPKS